MKSILFTFSDAGKTNTGPDHEEAEAEDPPPACRDLHLNWNNIMVENLSKEEHIFAALNTRLR